MSAEGEGVAKNAQESHEALWASMTTVVVQDCAPSQTVQRCAPPVEDSPASSCCSGSGSSTSESGGDTPRRVVEFPGVADKDDAPLAFEDLFGQGEAGVSCQDASQEAADVVLNMPLPSVTEAQQQLDHIMALRSNIQAISSKYSGSGVVPSPEKSIAPGSTEAVALPVEIIACPETRTVLGNSSCKEQENVERSVNPKKMSPPASPPKGPTRFFGPAAHPDPADVTNVMQQLGRRLRQLKVAEASTQLAGNAEVAKNDSGAKALPIAATACASNGAGYPVEDRAVGLPLGSEGFAIGGGKTAPAATAAVADPARAAALSHLAGGPLSGRRPVAVDEEKLRASRELEEKHREEMWKSFLSGDDRPVGSDELPPPELYHGQ